MVHAFSIFILRHLLYHHPERTRRHIRNAPEHLEKVMRRLIPYGFCNLIKALFFVAKHHIAGLIYPHQIDVFYKRNSHFPMEQRRKIAGRNIYLLRHIRKADLLLIVLGNHVLRRKYSF